MTLSRPPLPTLPELACNAHCHVFGPVSRFPFSGRASSAPPPDAPREALYALNDRLGFKRCVVVQSAVHGFDNRAAEEAVAGRPLDYRGVALLPTDVSDAEIARLDALGFRGVRFNYMRHLGAGAPIDAVLGLASRMAEWGWHLQIHASPDDLVELAPALRRSPVPVVIDHIARIDASQGMEQAGFRTLLALMEDTRFWVKVSGVDRITHAGPPYDDAVPYAARLVADFPDRVVWGNDWPHPNHAEAQVDDDLLVATLPRIAPDADALHALLVDNPARLYRFSDA